MGLETLALMISSVATTTFGANLLYLGTYALTYAGLAYGSTALQGVFADKPSVPKPEDGSFNLKQNVPSLSFVLGRVKKGGDYVFLEETGGVAFHILVMACHQINGYQAHYLHDEIVTIALNGDVIAPSHFVKGSDRYVNIETRHGLNAETAYSAVVGNFPTIWTADHRGDGLATVKVSAASTSLDDFFTIYPNQMPQHSAVLEGALLYDPRIGDTRYSSNLTLMRLWHLTHAVGGKMALADMYLPEWSHAADVSDQFVSNRNGNLEHRYHGGFWFRANNNPVDVGRMMDQAAEMVVYERPDGLVGVHAGEYVAPDIRLTRDDIISVQFDANTRDETNVLAVRGRYTNPDLDFATCDAAIWGDPYIGDDSERTKTLDNQAIQSHNHVQRLQKITEIRANAPRVSVLSHYEPAKNIPYRRFVKVHLPPKMNEAVIEITSSPRLSLRNLTIEFSGIIVPAGLYAFNGLTEEGVPPPVPDKLAGEGVPEPEDFNVIIQSEVVSGGGRAAFGKATWTIPADGKALSYELVFEPTALTDPEQSVRFDAGKTQGRTPYLADNTEYRFRIRSWENGVPSAWLSYITRTTVADSTAPGTPKNMQAINSSGTVAVSARSANDNTRSLIFKRGTTGQSFAAATVLDRYTVGPNQLIALDDVPGPGTWKYWCGAENGSGVPSAANASATVTVS